MGEFFQELTNTTNWDIITTIGLLIAVSFLGSKIFQRLGIPQVVGFIVIGVFMGESFLNLVPLELIDNLGFISELALGLIGFDIGGHLLFRDLRKYGRSIIWILILQSVGTAIVVGIGVYLLTQNIVLAFLMGAIASATDPAATVDVLAEYDTKGPLTTILLAVVGLDDGMALLLFSLGAVLAESFFTGGGSPSFVDIIELPLIEIGGSILLGLLMGLLLEVILRRMRSHHDAMAISIAFVFICVGISQTLHLSLILSNMVLGLVIVNREPEHGRYIRYTIEQAGPVIYVLFFTLIGARLQIDLLPAMGLLGLVYIVLRFSSKYGGAYIGGIMGGVNPNVKKYLGFALLSQAGVAIGLALEALERFSEFGPEGEELGLLVLSVVTATTFVAQLVGPVLVKFAVSRSGEIGKAREGDDAWASEGAPEIRG
ncbi:MAG: cation:proton antiporter [Anaerolineales bacterium]|nr:cation:proton antiporter [Anaerolineales bacterium]